MSKKVEKQDLIPLLDFLGVMTEKFSQYKYVCDEGGVLISAELYFILQARLKEIWKNHMEGDATGKETESAIVGIEAYISDKLATILEIERTEVKKDGKDESDS